MSDTPGLRAEPRLRRLRLLTRAALASEALLPRLLPALLPPAFYAALALLGLLAPLPLWLKAFAFIAMLGATLVLLARLRHLHLPNASQTDRRLEAQSGLPHQPLRVLQDAAVAGSSDLWALHIAHAQSQLARLRLDWPRPVLAAADPRALRGLAVLLIVSGVIVAGPNAATRLRAAFWPGFSLLPTAAPSSLTAWIAPPGYTGLPPLVLKPEGGAVTVPEGSVFTATLSASDAAPKLALGDALRDFTRLDANGFQISTSLATSGHIAIRNGERDVAGWSVTIEADEPPRVVFPQPPHGVAQQNGAETLLPWQVSHRYGVARLSAELVLADRPDAPPLLVPIPLPGAPKQAKGVEHTDLAANPWAGLPVVATLIARDVAGHEARSEPQRFQLPERRFRNRMARAVIAIRRELSLHPTHAPLFAGALAALGEEAEFWDDDPSGYLNLASIAALLRHARGEIAQAQSRLWDLALHLEEGAPDRTERALETARREMHEALDAQNDTTPPENNDSPHKAEQLADALRQRLEALSQAARRDPDSRGYNPDAHPDDRKDMQRLTDALREASKQGKRDIARDLMAELDRKLDALKGSRADRKPDDNAKAEKRRQGKRQMNILQEMVQREGQLLDRAQFRPYDLNKQADELTQSRVQDRSVQQALLRVLGLLMQQYGELSGSVPPHLSKAGVAMRDAIQSLAQGRDTAAAAAEQAVIEALQQGGRDMRQQMAQQLGQGDKAGDQSTDEQDGDQQADGDDGDDDGSQMADGDDGNGMDMLPDQNGRPGQGEKEGRGRRRADRQGRDPLGRPRSDGNGGLDDDGETAVPEQMEAARTRELQEELRRRSADKTRALEELRYIERLLKQF